MGPGRMQQISLNLGATEATIFKPLLTFSRIFIMQHEKGSLVNHSPIFGCWKRREKSQANIEGILVPFLALWLGSMDNHLRVIEGRDIEDWSVHLWTVSMGQSTTGSLSSALMESM